MWGALFGLLFYNCIVLYLYIKYKKYGDCPISSLNYWKVIWAFVFFGIIGVQFGDYQAYGELVHKVYTDSLIYTGNSWMEGQHMEPLYNKLAVLCGGNYFMWRFAWVATEFLSFGFMFKKIGHNNYQSLFAFSTCALFSVCAGRVSWGLVFFFMGWYTFFQTKDYKYLFFVAISFFAHSSMLVLFALTPALLFRNNKRIIYIFVLTVPLLIGLFANALRGLVELSLLNANVVNKLVTYYLVPERASNLGDSIGEYIHHLLERIPLYYLIIIFIIDVLNKKISIPYESRRFFNLTIALFALTQVAFFSDFGTSSLYVRFFYILYLPVFLLVYCSNGKYYFKKRIYKVFMLLLWIAFNVNYLKAAFYYSLS